MVAAEALQVAEELEGELTRELSRAAGERAVLESLDGARIEARIAERKEFEERAGRLQERLRALLRSLREAAGPGLLPSPASPDAEEARLAGLLAMLARRAGELSRLNALNSKIADRSFVLTRAWSRALAPRPAAYDRHGAETAGRNALGTLSRRA